MRAHISIALLLFLIGSLAPSVRASGAAPGSASLVYQNRVSEIVVRSVLPALGQRLDQLIASGGAKIYFRISTTGQVETASVVSPRPNSFVRDTCLRGIRSTKFPPLPEAVRREQKKNYLDMSVQIGG
jgi:outer membrane biosynthesis protein TonB